MVSAMVHLSISPELGKKLDELEGRVALKDLDKLGKTLTDKVTTSAVSTAVMRFRQGGHPL
jgi:hypothetical protein